MRDRLVGLKGCIIGMMLLTCGTCEFPYALGFGMCLDYTDRFDARSGFKWADVGFPFPCDAVARTLYTLNFLRLLSTAISFLEPRLTNCF